ncbi:hypothetical protein J5N97_027273 [Dioscorea zingiberensis]|uniref:Pentatricopeptide repeat-containing protein n=1 Tax=Dioscorea zingiberensis TaxID=325984 RepID=A0A9D5H7J2_9LILI|nr:hypothetical protein J5N97_027273 [Dioscorea zingiberensis]
MYTKCGFVHDALRVFDGMPQRDVISWNTIIDGYFLSGMLSDVFRFFREMLRRGVALDEFSFTSILRSCVCLGSFGYGLAVHCLVIKCGFCGSAFVANGLIEAYAKFRVLRESMKVFVDVEHKDIVLVSAMIGLLVKAGNLEEAFVIFLENVLASPMQPERAIFVNLLGGINRYEIFREGLQVHGLIVKFGFEADGVVENSLVMMYCNCDHVDDAFALLIQSGSKNPMSWTSLIKGYANLGCYQEAIDTFVWINHEGNMLDNVSLACILCVAADAECLQIGTQLHATALKSECESDSCIAHALMDMYAKCQCMGDALKLFEQIGGDRIELSWTIMISGYVHNGSSTEALRLFYNMNKRSISADSVTCVSVLMGCTDLKAIQQGEQVHAFLIKSGYETDISVQTSLFSLYSECRSLHEAAGVFAAVIRHDIVSWTALVSSYAKHGYNEEALFLLLRMLQDGVKPNHFTLASALTASSKATSTQTGKLLHALVIKTGLDGDTSVGSALIDMYSKCGSIVSAVSYFEGSSKCDIFLWNALLTGHAQHGNVKELLRCFEEMLNYKLNPDGVTFLVVLNGCSHCGYVDRVMHYYNMMQDKYGIRPEVEHCTCVVDALVRANLFKEAVNFIQRIGHKAGPEITRTLISSCATAGLVRLGLAAAARMVVSGQTNTSAHVLLSNLYALDNKWIDVRRIREAAETNHINIKQVGKSWILC